VPSARSDWSPTADQRTFFSTPWRTIPTGGSSNHSSVYRGAGRDTDARRAAHHGVRTGPNGHRRQARPQLVCGFWPADTPRTPTGVRPGDVRRACARSPSSTHGHVSSPPRPSHGRRRVSLCRQRGSDAQSRLHSRHPSSHELGDMRSPCSTPCPPPQQRPGTPVRGTSSGTSSSTGPVHTDGPWSRQALTHAGRPGHARWWQIATTARPAVSRGQPTLRSKSQGKPSEQDGHRRWCQIGTTA
jgi:hypothetical protein